MPRKAAIDALTLFDSLVYTCQYRVSIDLPGDALAWVMQTRHALRDRIGRFECFYRLPGVTLMEAELPPEYERALADAVARALQGQQGFRLRINGIAHSDDRRWIHAVVEAPARIAALQRLVADHVRSNRRIRKLGVELPPIMLPIAGPLKAAQFEESWALLGRESFTAERLVSDLSLMKREVADESLDEHLRTIRLEPLI